MKTSKKRKGIPFLLYLNKYYSVYKYGCLPEASLLYMLESTNCQALFIFRDNKLLVVQDVRLFASSERTYPSFSF
jgi:hypothetical protein